MPKFDYEDMVIEDALKAHKKLVKSGKKKKKAEAKLTDEEKLVDEVMRDKKKEKKRAKKEAQLNDNEGTFYIDI